MTEDFPEVGGSLPRGDIRPRTLEAKSPRQDTYGNRTAWDGYRVEEDLGRDIKS